MPKDLAERYSCYQLSYVSESFGWNRDDYTRKSSLEELPGRLLNRLGIPHCKRKSITCRYALGEHANRQREIPFCLLPIFSILHNKMIRHPKHIHTQPLEEKRAFCNDKPYDGTDREKTSCATKTWQDGPEPIYKRRDR